jgi:hypothetical protein
LAILTPPELQQNPIILEAQDSNMAEVLLTATVATPVLARGRGAARLLEGLWNGDPVAWGIVGVIVAVMVGIALFKRFTGMGSDD